MNKIRYIPIHAIIEQLCRQVCKGVVGYLAFSSCDTISAFCGLGKKKCFNLFRNSDMFIDVMKQISDSMVLSEDIIKIGHIATVNPRKT